MMILLKAAWWPFSLVIRLLRALFSAVWQSIRFVLFVLSAGTLCKDLQKVRWAEATGGAFGLVAGMLAVKELMSFTPETAEAIAHEWRQGIESLRKVSIPSDVLDDISLPTFPKVQQRDAANAFRDCEKCPELVRIPAGSFRMGTDGGDGHEAPAHEARIQRPFAIGKYKVTFAEWDACFEAGGCKHLDDSGWGRADRPVINVSWDDTQAYIAWLKNKTGKSYRLPTEAEWEFAARAGTTGPYSFDGPLTPSKANYNASEAEDAPSDIRFREKTVPVTQFVANGYGLYQVHGNAFEWVDDCWMPNYNPAPPQVDCGKRVIRAGSWRSSANELRSTWRGFGLQSRGSSLRGFRIARDLP